MDFETINIKEDMPTVEIALATLMIEIENCKKSPIKGIKVIHGYGSHGVGGILFIEIRKLLKELKNKKLIKNYFTGEEWTLENVEAQTIIKNCKSCYGDCDLGKRNPGITIIYL